MDSFIPLSVPNFGVEEAKNANECILSGWVSTSGAKVAEFEEAFARYTGCARAVAANSGTSALHLAAMAAGFGPGQEILVPSLTFIAAVNPTTRYVGATPVFIGCDDSLCMDPAAARRFCEERCTLQDGVLVDNATGNRVTGMVVVHVFGNLADMDALMDVARDYHLTVIEDATEALGTRCTAGRYAGKMAGTIGDLGCCSFNGNKIITTGAGGMVYGNRADWLEHAKHLSTQAKTDLVQFYHNEVGYNYRMTNVQAAIGLAQLAKLEDFIAHKTMLYETYKRELDGVNGFRILPFNTERCRPNCWFFSLYLPERLERDAVIAALQEKKIQTRPIWALINEQADYAGEQTCGLEKAEDYRAHIVNLPCSTSLSFAECRRVIAAVLEL